MNTRKLAFIALILMAGLVILFAGGCNQQGETGGTSGDTSTVTTQGETAGASESTEAGDEQPGEDGVETLDPVPEDLGTVDGDENAVDNREKFNIKYFKGYYFKYVKTGERDLETKIEDLSEKDLTAPFYPGAEKQGTAIVQKFGNNLRKSLYIETDDSFDDVKKFYRENMPDAAVVSVPDLVNITSGSVSKDEHVVNVTVKPDTKSDKTLILLEDVYIVE